MPPKAMSKFTFWNRLPEYWQLLLVMAIGSAVRFLNISKASIWHDEGYTMLMAPLPPGEILRRTALDVHPPLYYLVLHSWLQLFGTSELAARSLSAVLMIAVIPISYALVKQLFDRNSAIIAALFVALAPFLVRYSQEARMYGMLTFIASLATWLLVIAKQKNRWTWWAAYGSVIVMGLYTHYHVIFVIAFHWGYVAFAGIWPKANWQNIRNNILNTHWIAVNTLAVLAFIPWLPIALKQFTNIQNDYWIPQVTGDTLPSTIARFLTNDNLDVFQFGAGEAGILIPSPGLRSLLFLAFIICLAFLIWQERKKNLDRIMLLALNCGLAPVVLFFLSFNRPTYYDRYFVYAAVAFYIILALIITRIKLFSGHSLVRNGLVVLVGLVFSIGTANVYSHATHPMRALAQAIDEQIMPGDALVNGDFYTYFDYRYYNHTGIANMAYVPGGFPGCCEGKSMLYDHPEAQLKNFADLRPDSGFAWIIGRSGEQDYFSSALPASWSASGERIVCGSLAAQRFRLR